MSEKHPPWAVVSGVDSGSLAATVTGRPPTRPLLATKLAIAPLPEGLVVPRDRLWDRLDAGTHGPITLVSAPAGWGKTVLLASWCRSGRSFPCAGTPAWLTIEPGDHGARFWPYLAAALRGAAVPEAPTSGELGEVIPYGVVRHAHPPGGPVEFPDGCGPEAAPDRRSLDRRFLEELAAELAHRPGPVVLVLDDVHRAGAPTLVADLDFLSRHAGEKLRLVIATRTDLAVPAHRWRLNGELTEIRAAELAFTEEEVAELLAAHETRLPAERRAALHAGTEGWAAALRFAALELRGRSDPASLVTSFTGDRPPVADYLTDEVLCGLPGETREALVRGAVPEQICGPLLDALTGRGDGEELLAEVARTTGFLLPIDVRPGDYRYHRMLRDLLRAGLRRLPGAERLDLHRRAAAWYAGQGSAVPALRHALTAGDGESARRLLREHWADLVPYCPPGGCAPATGGVGPPPPEPAVDAELALAYAAERLNSRDPATAADHLALASARAHLIDDGRRDWFAAVCAGLRLACDQLRDEHDQLRNARDQVRDEPAGAATDEPTTGASDVWAVTDQLLALAGSVSGAAAIARAVRGATRLGDGDLAGAERELSEGLAQARRAGPRRAAVVCAGRLALAYATEGRLRAAEEAARSALDEPSGPGAGHPADLGYAWLARAVVALHRDLPDDTWANLGLAEQYIDGVRDPTAGVVLAVVRAQLCRDRADLLGAGEALAQGRRRLAGRPPGWPPGDWLLAAEADLRTVSGDPAAARHLLEAATRPHRAVSGGPVPHRAVSGGPVPHRGVSGGPVPRRGPQLAAPLAVALARAVLAGGEPRDVEPLLPEWAGPVERTWPLALRLEAGLLAAVAMRAVGDGRGAARRLEEVLARAEPEGFRRVFTRSVPPARELLADHLDSGTAYWSMVTGLLAGSEAPPALALGGRNGHGGRLGTGPAGRSDAGAPLREPLTERELTILRYLQSILSNVEIAAELSLSVNTVKTHVRNIYRKLDAGRRREAVRRARELHLI